MVGILSATPVTQSVQRLAVIFVSHAESFVGLALIEAGPARSFRKTISAGPIKHVRRFESGGWRHPRLGIGKQPRDGLIPLIESRPVISAIRHDAQPDDDEIL